MSILFWAWVIFVGVAGFFIWWQESYTPWQEVRKEKTINEGQRKNLAKTALTLLEEGAFTPIFGMWLTTPSEIKNITQALHDPKHRTDADIFGALIMALAASGKLTTLDLDMSYRQMAILGPSGVLETILPYFSEEEIIEIEVAYEGFSSLYPDQTSARALEYHKQYEDYSTRKQMQEILSNIAKNGYLNLKV